jgi:xanthine dehydrogenase accessory factor
VQLPDQLSRHLACWLEDGPVARATLVAASGSTPLPIGSVMLVSARGDVVGSVSGGCVEAAVHDLALEVLATGRPVRRSFGYADSDALEVGLTCGGRVEVLVERLTRADLPLADPLGPAEDPARLIVVGAVDFAVALSRLGRFLGDRVTVCDARPVFTTPERFPDAEVVVDWPHRYLRAEAAAGRIDERTAICVLTHDAKFDTPALVTALRLPAVGFVGAMGSRRTHLDRTERLRAAGLTEDELARLSSPIGLDLGGRTVEETALSILAEVVAHRHGGSGLPLSLAQVPIHRPAQRRSTSRPVARSPHSTAAAPRAAR